MSLEQSLDHLVRKGKASLAEVTRLSLEPDRSKAAFIHARAPVPVNTYPDGREAQAAEAKRIADWAMGGAKP